MSLKKSLFPQLGFTTYLNHAAMTPLHARAAAAMEKLMGSYARDGVHAWAEGQQCRDRVREKIAQLMGAYSQDIGLTQNTSHGALIVANEYPWREGDGLVLVRGEFPANVVPWLNAARQFKLKVLWLDPEDLATGGDRFREVMAQKPCLLAVSWVQYQTGRTLPMAELSHLRETHGIHIAVDAIQGLGALRLDLSRTPLDFVFGGGHKWLMSPEGTGYLYVHPDRMPDLNPVMIGWMSQENAFDFLSKGAGLVDYDKPFRASPDRFEFGTAGNLAFAGMEASLDLLLETGPARVEARILALAEYAREALRRNDWKVLECQTYAGIVSIPMEAEALCACFQFLQAGGISTATPDGHLRISPHFFNEEGDIDHFIEVLRRFQNGRKGGRH